MRIELNQGSDIWKDYRKNKIGASDVAPILGLSPFKTAINVYREKLGLEVPFCNSHMIRGNSLEPEARERFNQLEECFCVPEVYVSDKTPFMMASLDGFCPVTFKAVEIKCPNKRQEDISIEQSVPSVYYPQLQAQMYCADLQFIYYFTYWSYDDYSVVIVKRDEEFIDKMVKDIIKFWDDLQNFIEPPLQSKDYVDLSVDMEFNDLESEYCSVDDQIKSLEYTREMIRDKIIQKAQDKNSRGLWITVSKCKKKGNIDYKKIPTLKDINLEDYRKAGSEYWSITNRR